MRTDCALYNSGCIGITVVIECAGRHRMRAPG